MGRREREAARESTAAKIERALIQVKVSGQPTTKEHWRTVIITLIRLQDDALEEVMKQCRPMGCAWLYPVVEEILRCVAKKIAHRGPGGILVFPDGVPDHMRKLWVPGSN